MNEHPILFSGEMVKAILDGRKTQTRRVIKRGVVGRMMSGDQKLWPYVYDKRGKSVAVPCPYGQPGDLLWVRETWATSPFLNDIKPSELSRDFTSLFYRANQGVNDSHYSWRPSIHMSRWASRINLEVTGVRVGRVQDISEADAVTEGMEVVPIGTATWTNRQSFGILWDKINAKRGYSWDSNPWVWVVEFKKL